jgi:hypothetical protein
LSFWKTREQAERYGQGTYPAVKEVLLVSLETDPPGENLQRGKLTTSQHDSGQGGLVQPEKSLDEPVTGLAVVLRQSAPSTNGAFKYPTTGHKACFRRVQFGPRVHFSTTCTNETIGQDVHPGSRNRMAQQL